eukprot:763403-Hanusia_phi.AAC.2
MPEPSCCQPRQCPAKNFHSMNSQNDSVTVRLLKKETYSAIQSYPDTDQKRLPRGTRGQPGVAQLHNTETSQRHDSQTRFLTKNSLAQLRQQSLQTR